MGLTDTREMLAKARAEGYAVGAFNVENMEMVMAVAEAAEELRAPVILQTTPGTLRYAPPALFAGMAVAAARGARAPIALHLDHGDSAALAQACKDAGYTSLMIDGSTLPYAENVALTRAVVKLAGDLPVEAELGTVGGKEDGHEARTQYTDPAQAAAFVRDTGVSSFAPAIGTAHGVYARAPKLDLALLSAIRAAVPVPLVLHGTSGVPDDTVQACVRLGVCKVNYATELRIAFTGAARAYLAAHPDAYDPKKPGAAGRDAVRARVMQLITLLGGEGKG